MADLPTLADYGYDGRAALTDLIGKSPWGSLEQALASLTVFAHPDVVRALGARAVFPTIRGLPKYTIVDGVMLDDNASPHTTFLWATGLPPRGRDRNCNHIYAASKDPTAYSDVRNICYTPNFVAKLTDIQTKKPEKQFLLNHLKYRAFELFGYRGPTDDWDPVAPEGYERLVWAAPIGEGAEAVAIEARFRKNMARRPKDPLPKAANRLGWSFSNMQPDPTVVYTGGAD